MISPAHLLDHIIRPVLKSLDLHSPAAEKLMLGTAATESACGQYLVQLGGPALGIWQMEAATHDDCWTNYLAHRPQMYGRIKRFVINSAHPAEEMVGNLYYACAMARIKYARDSAPIPDTLPEQAAFWKRVYNSAAGAGTAEKYIAAWRTYVPPNLFS